MSTADLAEQRKQLEAGIARAKSLVEQGWPEMQAFVTRGESLLAELGQLAGQQLAAAQQSARQAEVERALVRLRQAEETTLKLTETFGRGAVTTSQFRDNYRVHVEPERVFEVLSHLKQHRGFDMLAELGGADYFRYPGAKNRYGVWYCLLNTTTGERLIVKTYANDPRPKLPTVWPLWKGSDWMEREVYDMYGVEFEGHPDLRRILMPDEFTSFPLRKDYPMRGNGERHNFRPLTRAEG